MVAATIKMTNTTNIIHDTLHMCRQVTVSVLCLEERMMMMVL